MGEEVKIKIGDNKELSCGDHEGTFKWTLHGKLVEGESGKVLSIEDFTADFDNSVVRCLQEKVNGETRILRQFKLLTEKAEGKGGSQVRKPVQLQQTSEPGLQYDQPAQIASEKPIASGNIFTCVSEGEEDTDEAEYVWVNGRLEKRVKKGKGKQEKGKALKCKLVPGGAPPLPSAPPFLPPSPFLSLPHITLLLSSLPTLRCSTPILSPLSTAVSPSLVVPTSCPTPLPQTPSFLPTSSLTT